MKINLNTVARDITLEDKGEESSMPQVKEIMRRYNVKLAKVAIADGSPSEVMKVLEKTADKYGDEVFG